MANQLYPKAKEDFLNGNLNLSSNTITIALVDTDVYTFDAELHQFRSNVPNTAVVATANLASKTITDGVFDAADITFTAVSGANCEALILYHNTGNAEADGNRQADSRLIAYIDTATGLPILPNGGDITVRFSNGASKIFAL
jgi:hypothetical protein